MSEENAKTADSSAKVSEPIDESFDTMGLLLDYLHNWKWFVLCAIVAVGIAYYKYSTIIPTYEVAASIFLSDENQKASQAVTMGASALVDTKNFIDETELEMLKSRNTVIKIVDSLGLAYNYMYKGRLRDVPVYRSNQVNVTLDSIALQNLGSAINAEIKGDGKGKYDISVSTTYGGAKEKKEFNDVELPFEIELSQGTLRMEQNPTQPKLKGTLLVKIKNPRSVASQISSSLSIGFAYNSFQIVRITCRTPVISKGVDIVNALIDYYNQSIIEEKNRGAVQTEAFILDRLVLIAGELKDVENRLQDYRQKHQIVNIDAQANMNLSAKTGYSTELAQIDAQLTLLGEIEKMVSNADIYETVPSAVSDPTISAFIEAYNRKVIQLNRVMMNSTPDNPVVQNMQREINNDKQRLLANISSVRRTINNQRSTISALENKSAGALSELPPLDKGLQEIFREQSVKENIYTFLLQRREEIALQKALATNTARLIDNPVGYGPVAPNRDRILLMGLLIGLILPAAIIYLRRLIFPIFKDQQELERITKVPVIGEISQLRSKTKKEIVIGHNVSTPEAELFRLLRNNIGFTRKGGDNQVILVTSSISGEGKTFIALNLAMTYALTGKKVCVVGLDIRRPTLAHRFHFSNERGVTTFLSGQETDINKLIHATKESPNLYVLPAGPLAPNPNELLMAPTMDKMMEDLRKEFDYIIIDSAPIGIISDTFLILRHTDLQLFVTRANYSSKNGLRVLHQAIQQGKFEKVYIVLNGVNMGSNSYLYRRYGQYGHYTSGHGRTVVYGYGYTSSKEKSGEETNKEQ